MYSAEIRNLALESVSKMESRTRVYHNWLRSITNGRPRWLQILHSQHKLIRDKIDSKYGGPLPQVRHKNFRTKVGPIAKLEMPWPLYFRPCNHYNLGTITTVI